MARRIVVPKQVQYVSFVLDYSGSMAGLATALEKGYENELKRIRENAKEKDIETFISIYVFGDNIQKTVCQVSSTSPLADKIRYKNMGMTALYDAIGYAIDDFTVLSNKRSFENSALLVIVLTDGAENASVKYRNSIGSLIQASNARGNITTSIRCPASVKPRMVSIGIPEDNISVWDGSEKELKMSEVQTCSGIDAYYGARSRGLTSTSNFYQPDTNFSPTTLKRNVSDVTHKFLLGAISRSWDGKQIRDYVERELRPGETYEKGNAFYELTKKETVQAHKEIVIRDVSTGKMYSDDDARDLLGLPVGQEIKVIPSNYTGKYELFIQSSSVNRKLVGGTKLLYKAVK